MSTPQSPRSSDEAGRVLLEAKHARVEQERRLAQVKNRIDHLKEEEARVAFEISEAKQRTSERKELAARSAAIKKVGAEVGTWQSAELEQRKRVIAEQRQQQTKNAIEAKRLALLEARHADFLTKKEEERQARAAIIAHRTTKVQIKHAQMESIRAGQSSARRRKEVVQKEREVARQEEDAIEQAHEEDQVKLSLKELEQLAKEEERLLGSVTKVHAQHREEVTKLEAAAAAVGRPHLLEAARPSPFAITKPLPPDSPRMARKPSSPKPPSSPRSPRRELWER